LVDALATAAVGAQCLGEVSRHLKIQGVHQLDKFAALLFLKARIRAARFFQGPLYRWITLRMHAASLASPFDSEGEVPWSEAKSRQLFTENTPYSSYVARAKAVLDVDYLDRLSRINVPTLIITPEHDTLIGERPAKEMLEGIADAHEVVLERTGHMLRYSHPVTYARTIRAFLEERFGDNLQAACA